MKILKKLEHWQHVFSCAGKRFFQGQYTYRASALAFTTLLSLVPLLSVIVFIVAKFPIFSEINAAAQTYILTNLIPTSGDTIQFYLNNFTQQAEKLPTVSITFLFITGFALIITIEHTLNDIWEVRWKKRKLVSLMIYWIMLMLAPLVIGIGVLISTYLFSLAWLGNLTYFDGLKHLLLGILPLLINTMIFSVLYIIVPNFSVSWKSGLAGGFVASVLFEFAKSIFAFYFKHFPSYELVYGTLAAIPIFLIWLYISWLIILFGALVTNAQYKAGTKP